MSDPMICCSYVFCISSLSYVINEYSHGYLVLQCQIIWKAVALFLEITPKALQKDFHVSHMIYISSHAILNILLNTQSKQQKLNWDLGIHYLFKVFSSFLRNMVCLSIYSNTFIWFKYILIIFHDIYPWYFIDFVANIIFFYFNF